MHWLIEQMGRAATWLKPVEGELKPADPAMKYAKTYLERVGEWRLRPLLGVVQAPTLRPDGTVLQKPGYDSASRLIFDPCGEIFPLSGLSM